MNAKEEFESKLRESKEKYANQLPKKISEIKVIWNQLFNKNWNGESFLKLQRCVNNLAGSGSTFGFPKLSEKARVLQNILKNMKNDTRPNIVDKVNINDLVNDLEAIEQGLNKDFHELSNLSKVMSADITDTNRLENAKAIYIFDPDPYFSLELSVQINSYNYETVVINDVNLLQKKIQETPPLVILMDVDFSETTLQGRTLIQLLQEKYLLTCPIIFISSKEDLATRMRASKAFGEAYFTKPLDIGLLLERINTLTNLNKSDPYRVLIIDDDEELVKYYSLFLERAGIKVFTINDPDKILDVISKDEPELIVMGMSIVHYNGLDLSKVIRQHQSYLTLPIVLLSAERDANIHYSARQIGVDDFLVKPISGQQFLEAILSRIQRSRFVHTNLARDNLTGAFTIGKMKEHLETQLSVCKRYNRPLSYALLEIDNFKSINETYGYLTGDRVLINFSNLLKRAVRSSDFIGRTGGGEFVLILPEATSEGAKIVIDRIQTSFNVMPQNAENKILMTRFSAGVVTFPAHGTVEDLMKSAKYALSTAKSNGGNSVIVK